MELTPHLRRVTEIVRPYRGTLIAFAVAAVSLIVAGIYILSPDIGESTATRSLAGTMTRGFVIAFGPATLLLALLAGIHAVLHLIERGVPMTPPRWAASTGLVLFLPALFALFSREGSAGGAVGLIARDAVVFLFPPLFAVPLLVGLVLLSVMFATDWLFYGRFSGAFAVAAPSRPKAKRKPSPKAKPKPVVEIPDVFEGDEEPEYEEDEYEEDEYEEDEYEDGEEAEDEDEEYEDEEEAEYDEDEEDDDDEEYEEDEELLEDDEEDAAVEEAPKPAAKPKRTPTPEVAPIPRPVVASAPPPRVKKRGASPLPPIDLLEPQTPVDLGRLERAIQANAQILEKSLASFRIETRVVGYTRGPVITMFELALKEGTKLSQIVNRADDLAIALKAESVRIVAPIPGKNTVGVEVPNVTRADVRLCSLLEESQSRVKKMAVPIFLGKDAAGQAMIEDLASMPHLLIAGATGSGKSVCINSIILSVLMTRHMEQVRLILIDPKQVELAFFREIPHLLTNVVTDPRKAAQTLEWVVTEMEDRYRIFAMFGVRNIQAYNKLGKKKIKELAEKHDIGESSAPEQMPYLVVVVDELADLIMTGRKEVEQAVTRLAQKSRAVGIHSVLATQRPSTDVITGLIKANMPSRASFKVTSKVDSRVVLDQGGADKLLGRGDMLFLPPRSFHLVRAQGCFISDDEVRSVVQFLRENGPDQELRELIVRQATLDERDPRDVDSLFDSAVRIVLESQRGSASLLQRALQIGYTRASRLIDLMRGQGIIGEFRNAQASEILMTLEDYEAKYAGPEV